jgi:hypothetical protein
MKIINAWTHHETGIGTYTILGLGDDGKIYEWIECKSWVEIDEKWIPEYPSHWEIRGDNHD